MPPLRSLNESPSEKEGKLAPRPDGYVSPFASMKVPPKRKGNTNWAHHLILSSSLNESPSEKEGKSALLEGRVGASVQASMKVPPKRKGNYS